MTQAPPLPQPPAVPARRPSIPGQISQSLAWLRQHAKAVVLATVAVAGLLLLILWIADRRAHSMTDDAFVESHIVNVAPEMVSGRIVRFLVDENDSVEQGQLLAEIEPVHYRDQVEQARGKLE